MKSRSRIPCSMSASISDKVRSSVRGSIADRSTVIVSTVKAVRDFSAFCNSRLSTNCKTRGVMMRELSFVSPSSSIDRSQMHIRLQRLTSPCTDALTAELLEQYGCRSANRGEEELRDLARELKWRIA